MYKDFFALKCIPRKSTMNWAATNIVLFPIGRICKQANNVIMSPVYLGQTGVWERP